MIRIAVIYVTTHILQKTHLKQLEYDIMCILQDGVFYSCVQIWTHAHQTNIRSW